MSHPQSFARWTACLTFAIGMLASTAPSHAYRMLQNLGTGRVTAGSLVTCSDPNGFAHWGVANVNWYHNDSGVGAGKAAALYNAMNAWTFVPSANHSLTYAGRTSAGFATDGLNTVSWGSSSLCGSANGCLALTALDLQSGQVIIETDILFSTDWTWTTNGGTYDTQSVATHEFGHTVGIHHTDVTTSPLPTMYAVYFGTDARSLETDDKSALQCSQSHYPPTVSCIPDGGVIDSSGTCCSGYTVSGSSYCNTDGCFQICASVPSGGCAGSGRVDDTLSSTSCCSGAAVSGSTRCLNPADYGSTWTSCIQTCQ